ncbi:hypothetical protein [Niveispirillum sp. KHB5.9]|uniref:hypothetical protein n=1 Tax=Niveispirillum sp. KHB5.9 TaxID=3400269 RepID=UPI003A85FDC3
MRQFLRILLTSVPAGLCIAAPALADPVPVSIRVAGGVTELLIDSGDLKPDRFRLDQCGATLAMPLDQGMDISAASVGAGRIKGVTLTNPHTLAVATDCSAAISIKRRNGQMVMRVAAPVTPGRKPTTPPPPTQLTPEEAEFARKAVADGARDAATPPAREPTPTLAQDPRRPDPAWGSAAPLVDLAAWRQEPYLDNRDRLRQALAASDHAPAALRDLVRFQLAWNRAPEALVSLEGSAETEEDQTLLAIAALLADPDDSRADRLLSNQSLRASDGPFWAALLLQRRGQGRDGVRYLPAASRALSSLPADLRRELGLDLLSIAADARLDGMARAIARAIEADAGDPVAQAQLHEVVGRLHAAAGRVSLALAQWDQAAALEGAAATRAGLAALAMRVERGERAEAERMTALDAAIRDWPGTALEADSLWQLALLAQKRGEPVTALEKLRLLSLRFPDQPPPEMAARADMAVHLFDGLMETSISLPDRITAFQRHRDLLPSEPAGWAVRQRFAMMLADAGVERIAREELQALVVQLPAPDRPAIIHDLAVMELAVGDAAAALATLDGAEEATPDDVKRGKELRARALLLAGDSAGAMAMAGDGNDGLAVRADGLWRQGKWGEAAKSYKALAAGGPLPPADAARYALAAMLSGDPTADSVVQGQGTAFAGRKLGADLTLLARPVPAADAGERDLRGLLEDAAAVSKLARPVPAN